MVATCDSKKKRRKKMGGRTIQGWRVTRGEVGCSSPHESALEAMIESKKRTIRSGLLVG
jgi:GR25 family glycosyltransferase involved in LPS biosynthesis